MFAVCNYLFNIFIIKNSLTIASSSVAILKVQKGQALQEKGLAFRIGINICSVDIARRIIL